jgi:hypothetical protein
MHATAMHFAFLKAADINTDMGKRIFTVIKRQHDQMVREQAARQEAMRKQRERLKTSLDVM